MQFQGAVITEQGVTFAIVVVNQSVIDSHSKSGEIIAECESQLFPGMPVVLMAQDSWGTPYWRGRRDIVRFLSNVTIDRIPWMEYTVNLL